MASEIRVDKINSLSGVGTVSLSPTGVDISGITTAETLKATTGIVTTLTATTGILTTFEATTGDITTLRAPTGIVTSLIANTARATTGIVTTFVTNTAKVGAAVTITSDGIDASGIGITCANINGGAVGGRRNLVINGAMMVAQRGTSTTTNGYLIDRFTSSLGGIDQMQFTMSQSTDAPSGFRKSLKFDITTVESALESNEYAMIRYITESQDIAHFLYGTSGAKTITLSFHVKAYQTGTYALNLFVSDSGRSYTANYTISQSATWEKKTLTFVGDTSGSEVNVDNGHGLYINWFMASGTDYKSSNAHFNQWGTLGSATGWAYGHNVDLLNSTDNYFQLAGVQLEVGSQATPFEHRSFGDELTLCQRYFQFLGGSNGTYDSMTTGSCSTTTVAYVPHRLTHTMRTTPSFTMAGSASDFRYTKGGDQTPSGLTLDQAGANMVAIRVSAATDHLVADDAIRLFNINTTGAFQFDAEL